MPSGSRQIQRGLGRLILLVVLFGPFAYIARWIWEPQFFRRRASHDPRSGSTAREM
jgi:hypothetical protein